VSFQLFLFATDPLRIAAANAAGIDGYVVDWESIGKESRQSGADTQINHDSVEDLVRARAATKGLVLCRINGFGAQTPLEVEQAIGGGADEILLPMVRSPREVEHVLDAARERCGVGILIETVEALGHLPALGRLPLSRVYVGLNDLAIERREPDLFGAVVDGTLERIRSHFHGLFGFAALTVPEGGRPVPCRLLIGEMARLGCHFSFLRRSFYRDVALGDMPASVARLRHALEASARRAAEPVARERAELESAVRAHPVRIFESDERAASV
jgi:hypothetical protein